VPRREGIVLIAAACRREERLGAVGGDHALARLIAMAIRRRSFDQPVNVPTPRVAAASWNHIAFARGSDENGMETMKIHVLERALTAACIIAALAVVLWGVKIMAA
jgi:hypothetical protein